MFKQLSAHVLNHRYAGADVNEGLEFFELNSKIRLVAVSRMKLLAQEEWFCL
jgi:hypothetical protein